MNRHIPSPTLHTTTLFARWGAVLGACACLTACGSSLETSYGPHGAPSYGIEIGEHVDEVTYINSQEALQRGLNEEGVYEMIASRPYQHAVVNFAISGMPVMEWAVRRADGSVTDFQPVIMRTLETSSFDIHFDFPEPSPSLLIRFKHNAEAIRFVRAEFVESPAHDDSLISDDSPRGYDDGSIKAAVSHPGRWECDSGAMNAASQNPPTYNDAPSWNDRGCSPGDSDFSKTKPGTKVLAEYLKNNFEGAKSYGGYSCRQNTANSSQLSVHGTGRAIDLFVPLDGGEADNDLGDEIADWLLENSSAIGIQLVIWDQSIWSSGRATECRSYGGPHPHRDHLHIELNTSAGDMRTEWYMSQGFESAPAPSSDSSGGSSPTGSGSSSGGSSSGGSSSGGSSSGSSSTGSNSSDTILAALIEFMETVIGAVSNGGGGSNSGSPSSGGGTSTGGSSTGGGSTSGGSTGGSTGGGSTGGGSTSGGGTSTGGGSTSGGMSTSGDATFEQGCFSQSMKQAVHKDACVQVAYASECGGECASYIKCEGKGVWSCAQQSECSSTVHENEACGASTNPGTTTGGGSTSGGGTSGGSTSGSGDPPVEPPQAERACWSRSMNMFIDSGSCAQMPYEACGEICAAALCQDGAWACPQANQCTSQNTEFSPDCRS